MFLWESNGAVRCGFLFLEAHTRYGTVRRGADLYILSILRCRAACGEVLNRTIRCRAVRMYIVDNPTGAVWCGFVEGQMGAVR